MHTKYLENGVHGFCHCIRPLPWFGAAQKGGRWQGKGTKEADDQHPRHVWVCACVCARACVFVCFWNLAVRKHFILFFWIVQLNGILKLLSGEVAGYFHRVDSGF